MRLLSRLPLKIDLSPENFIRREYGWQAEEQEQRQENGRASNAGPRKRAVYS
jgi:hypothetical protein